MKKTLTAFGITVASASSAMAAIPANVTTAVEGAATDAAALAALSFLVVLGVWAIKRMRSGL